MGRSKEFINNQIIKYYATTDSTALASRLNISVGYLRVKARRLGVRKIRVNEIINGKKRCPFCGLIKDIEAFNRDKYQCNSYDYYCRSCRAIKKQLEIISQQKQNSSYTGSLAFNKGKKQNFIISKDGKDYLKCKSCEVLLPVSEFNADRQNHHGLRNTCRTCEALKRKGII